MDLELVGKTAFIAASSKGLGLASAIRLASEGANVVVSSRSEDNLDQASERIVEETGVSAERILTTVCDLTDERSIESAIETTVDQFGGIDIQINNHGGPPAVPFAQATDTDWDSAYAGIIKSNIWLTRHAIPHLQTSGFGSLITITSASARETPTNHALSNVFRLGLYGLSKTIAKEYGPTIRSNCICPRYVMTERIEYKVRQRAEHRGISVEDSMASRTEEVLLDRPGDPSEFADAVAFLASPRASYITGDILRVDGGWTRGVF